MKILFVLKDNSSKLKLQLREMIKKFPDIKTDFAWKNKLKKEQFKEKDLIVSVGGDGTFLSASHFIENQPILGINLDTEKSAGALTSASFAKLEERLRKILARQYSIKEYTRERVKIFKKNQCVFCEQALNEAYIGNAKPHHPSHYTLRFKKIESQKSSGILIATGTGSTAWYKAMRGFPFNRTKKQLRFIVREPFSNKIHKVKMKKGKINPGQKVQIISLMNHGILAIDSIREYPLEKNEIVEISLGLPLRVVQ